MSDLPAGMLPPLIPGQPWVWPDGTPVRVYDPELDGPLADELMSEEDLRATVRQFVKGITYASYYRSGKAQVTMTADGRKALVRLQALVSLEGDDD